MREAGCRRGAGGKSGLEFVVQLSEVDAGPVADEVLDAEEEPAIQLDLGEGNGRPARQALMA